MNCLSVLLFFIFSLNASAKVVVGSDPYPPLIYPSAIGTEGSVPRDLPIILNTHPRDIEYRFLPWKRVLSDAQKGSLDIIGPLLENPERAKYLVFTKPLMTAKISLWVRKDNPKLKYFLEQHKKIENFKELKDLTFGQILGYSFGDVFGEFFNNPSVKKVEVVDMAQGVRMLVSKRIDVFLAFDPVIEYYINDLKISRSEFTSLGEASKEVPYVMGISKKSPWAKKLPEINKRIEELKKAAARP